MLGNKPDKHGIWYQYRTFSQIFDEIVTIKPQPSIYIITVREQEIPCETRM